MIRWRGEPVVIVTQRLLLDTLDTSEAEEILKWANNPEVVRDFQFFTEGLSIEDESDYIRKMSDSPTYLLRGLFVDGEELIGTCGLHEIDLNNGTARLGIIIGKKEHWNKGYAHEAIRVLLNFAFGTMGLHKVYLNVFVTNKKGIHLYMSAGFRREGTLRQEYKIRGEYVDMYRMAIMSEQFFSQRGL